MEAPRLSRASRLRGGIIGLLVGDALGVPYEFHASEQLPPPDQIEMDPPPGFRRSHDGVPAGTYSDDGAQALVLLHSLLVCGRLDPQRLGVGLVNWHDWGHMAVDGHVFDVGVQTREAIERLRNGEDAVLAGGRGERANGNGSLMRVLPLALWHAGSDHDLVVDAFTQSSVTHGHLRSKLCCALYCLWARRILDEADDPWVAAVEALRGVVAGSDAASAELDTRILAFDSATDVRGSGYVVDSLRAARWANRQDTYEQVVRAAISLGDDTDTTACIAGGIAGLRFGEEAIPERWRAALRGRELFEPLIERLLARAG